MFYYEVQQPSYDYVYVCRQVDLVKFTYTYTQPYRDAGIDTSKLLVIGLPELQNKMTIAGVRELLEKHIALFKQINPKYIISDNAWLLKGATKRQFKIENISGLLTDCMQTYLDAPKELLFEGVQALYLPLPGALASDPLTAKTAIDLGAQALKTGCSVDRSASVTVRLLEATELDEYLESIQYSPYLAVDVETFSLQVQHRGLASIGFATSMTEGAAILVDLDEPNAAAIRAKLKNFFINYRHAGACIFHRAVFDVVTLVTQLYMEHPLDIRGLKDGVSYFENCHDTQIIANHCVNNVNRPSLKLKHLAQPYLGNWAVDVNDVRSLPTDKLLDYNAKDCIATYWLFETMMPRLIEDNQEYVYNTVTRPSIAVLSEAMCMGMPTDPAKVAEAREGISAIAKDMQDSIAASPMVRNLEMERTAAKMQARTAELKTKIPTLAECYEPFNPGSGQQLAQLLYDKLGFPIIERTKSGAPATDKDTLKALKGHTDD